MARPKTKLNLAKRRLLADLKVVSDAWAEAGAERKRLILSAKDANIPVNRIATASGLTD